jgi:hypothetical protein
MLAPGQFGMILAYDKAEHKELKIYRDNLRQLKTGPDLCRKLKY